MLLKCAQTTVDLHKNFKFAPATACIWHNFYLENLHFYDMVKNHTVPSTACVVLVRKTADDIRITIFISNPLE
jgi:hypothetical protein